MNSYKHEFLTDFKGDEALSILNDKYEIVQRLSESDTGSTYLLNSRDSGKYFVAKVSKNAGSADVINRLIEIKREGLPEITEILTSGDAKIIIRPYIAGSTLEEVVSERALTREEVLRISNQLLNVLSYLHAQTPPIIHRDIKPQNVILDSEGNVTLIDFGIARNYRRGAGRDTHFSGTIDFAPPEQYGFQQTDARADVYSMGMLMRYLINRGDIEKGVSDRRLNKVISRCTAFLPKRRYKSAMSVKRALNNNSNIVPYIAAMICLFIAGVAVGRYAIPYARRTVSVFSEPVIEYAVRQALDGYSGELTPEMLSAVKTLYIFQGEAFKGEKEYWEAVLNWYGGDMQSTEEGAMSLKDLAQLPNLAMLYMTDEPLTDITPLGELKSLEELILSDMAITNISALSELTNLRYLGLVNSSVKDISPLTKLEKLTRLDLTGGTCDYNPAPLAEMGDFEDLSLFGSKTAYKYIGDKRIGYLRLGGSDIDDLSSISGVTGLRRLDLSDCRISSIEGIEVHEGITELNIERTNITDISPLLLLPNLARLTLSEDMAIDEGILERLTAATVEYK